MGTGMLDLGPVRGNNGFSPIIEVVENDNENYRLKITTEDSEILTPNLHGTSVSFKVARVGVPVGQKLVIPFENLALNPARNYTFFAFPARECWFLRNIQAVQEGSNAVVSIYTDTIPYTEPQLGSPYPEHTIQLGENNLMVGDFILGDTVPETLFPVNLLCTELSN